MRKTFFILFTICSMAATQAQDAAKAPYHYHLNLNEVNNDELTVELNVQDFGKDELTFHLPKMVPGTYSIYDFGRFVSDLKAMDADGKELPVERVDDNSWNISNAKRLRKITYQVEDTWDTDKSNVIFEPAGTNIDDDEVFVLNTHGIFGFFAGFEFKPMLLEIDRPKKFFGGTALKRVDGDEDTDIYEVANYHRLVDSPIMFAEPDTAIIKVGNADVLIHTYSPTGKVKSKDLVADIQPILESQRKYLGGELPVDHYAFIIFLNAAGDNYLSGAAGALEHSYSSFYCLFEGEAEDIAQMVRDVAAHEFFHIVTPLSIHSEEIHYFDFIEPKMSKHLWLYEGVTEYSAQHVQVKQQLVSVEHFLQTMSQKLGQADQFYKADPNLSFTEMSLTCLDENENHYYNVYQKGALIGMCVDLKLRILSDGEYGIQDMMRDLSKRFGIEEPFKDDELFQNIADVTGHPEIKEFMEKYIAGTDRLPVKELMKEAGIAYAEDGYIKEVSMFGFDPSKPGGIGFDFKHNLLKIASASALDPFGKNDLGLREGDLIKKWDGEELSVANIQQVLTGYASKAKKGYDLNVLVMREKELSKKEARKRARREKRGKPVDPIPMEEVTLTAKLKEVKIKQAHAFNLMDDATEQQIKIRKSFLGDYLTESEMMLEKE